MHFDGWLRCDTPCDLRCTKVPTISLISYRELLNLVGISAGHERCLMPTKNLGHRRNLRFRRWPFALVLRIRGVRMPGTVRQRSVPATPLPGFGVAARRAGES